MATRPSGDDESDQMLRVVVVGGGASGVLVAARLLDASSVRPVHVTIVEPSGRLGEGVAYGTDDPEHLLNVRASGMSADPSRPDDLVRWIAADPICPGDGDTFLPRREYRRYLRSHIDRAASGAEFGELQVVAATVTSIVAPERPSDIVRLGLDSGASIEAHQVVLAIGNSAPGLPESFERLHGHPGWVPDPWAPGALDLPPGESTVLLIGTGLTMVDVAATLSRDDARRFTAISRRGLLPMAHVARQPSRQLSVIQLDRDGSDVLAVSDRVRSRICDGVGVEFDDEDWREVIDAIRPYMNALWRSWNVAQRRIFLDRVARDWEVRRHRMSPATATTLGALLQSGRLEVATGTPLVAQHQEGGQIQVSLVDGAGVHSDRLCADVIVNCTGPGRSWMPPANPLVADLFRRGLAAPDELGLGLDATADGRLIDAAGVPSECLSVVGPPRRGSLFETTAIPELRSQALHVAERLITLR